MSAAETADLKHGFRCRSSVARRAFLVAGIAGAVDCALPRIAHAATAIVFPVAAGDRRFSVLYKGNPIGAHTISYSPATEETRVGTEISLLVKMGTFTVFRFAHRSTEIWRAGQLMSLKSKTLEHGKIIEVEGAATPQGFRVVSSGAPFIASSATLTSNSLWTPAVLEQKTVVDAQHGGIIGVSARRFAEEQITVAGQTVRATRHRFITPYCAGSIWYDSENLWVHGEFERDGSRIQYRLEA